MIPVVNTIAYVASQIQPNAVLKKTEILTSKTV